MNISPALKKLPKAAPWIVLLALAVSNAFLIRQNLQMRAQLDKRNLYLQKGDKVPEFSVGGLHDEILSVGYTGAGKKRIFFFLSPDCPFCKDQSAYWKEILRQADPSRFEVTALVRGNEDKEKVADYIRSIIPPDSQSQLQVAMAPRGVLDSYKLTATPITLVVSNSGEVENIWVGKWDDKTAATAAAYFGLKLPQLQ